MLHAHLCSSFCPVLSSIPFSSPSHVSPNHSSALKFIMNGVLYVGPEYVWWTQGITTWVMSLSAQVSLATSHSLTLSLSRSHTHTHAWPAGNTGSCCIRPVWQGQLERSRRSTSSLLILSPLKRERQAVREDRRRIHNNSLSLPLINTQWLYSNLIQTYAY